MSGESAMVSILRGNWTYFPSLCWRRDLITSIGFRPDFHVVQDMALVMDVLMGWGRLVVPPEGAFRSRRHAGSDSAVKTVSGSRFHEEQEYYRTIAVELRAEGRTRAARAAPVHVTAGRPAAAQAPAAARARD